ncbi:rhodanese-like domain-containing protein [Blastochloris sulfoviridis]|uniref:Rhodanese-like domain-containing protein n=1 Tax=Blastochloris sulfoviridis TaxID=50712 RepID=A0A5M6I4L3_9HYPH|nr:rhodanese-like domain-containing protein [Blastochloris sulfoviridis]KAA5602739.1 rhodanese-like domain-containing protein [Blastochloris sulfoviridis]
MFQKHWWPIAACAVVLAAPAGPGAGPAAAQFAVARPADATVIDRATLERDLADNSIELIDIREPDEFAAGHIAGARNMPMSRLDPRTLAQPSDKPIVLVCRSGRRTARMLAAAQAAGATNINHYGGGMLDWQAAGKPVVKGP